MAERLEFKFANRNGTEIDNNVGRNYVIESPGRYVVESGSGCRRVADAQVADCLRAQRPKDTYVELMFNANPIWRNCYVAFCAPGEDALEWHKQQMELMEETGLWFQRVETTDGINCAFTDGNVEWDSNINLNYQIRMPGRYALGRGSIAYLGPSALDMHQQT
ncbi:hypothetical protein FGB62_30g051 [Gracilaria domingensis]|nr:hypothetical protein FGB62_30g051 [Gracilaria domingensis]